MVLTASFVLSPVIGLICHCRRRNFIRQLDASVEASRPHDFAVRIDVRRLSHTHASTASRAQRVVTIAKRPSCGARDARITRGDLPDGESGKFLWWGMDFVDELKVRGDLPEGQSAHGPLDHIAHVGELTQMVKINALGRQCM
jgi:hypothetical protein